MKLLIGLRSLNQANVTGCSPVAAHSMVTLSPKLVFMDELDRFVITLRGLSEKRKVKDQRVRSEQRITKIKI